MSTFIIFFISFLSQLATLLSIVGTLMTFFGSGSIITLEIYLPPWMWVLIVIGVMISLRYKQTSWLKTLETRAPGFVSISFGPISFSVNQIFSACRWTCKRLRPTTPLIHQDLESSMVGFFFSFSPSHPMHLFFYSKDSDLNCFKQF